MPGWFLPAVIAAACCAAFPLPAMATVALPPPFSATPVILTIVLACLGVAVLRLWQNHVAEWYRNTMLADACSNITLHGARGIPDIHVQLVRGGMQVSGADMAYLVQFHPDPVIAAHAHGEDFTITEPTGHTGQNIPLDAREFWAPLLDGSPYVMHGPRQRIRPSATYPLSAPSIRCHMAVAIIHGRTPLAILGVGTTSRFSLRDVSRLQTLLTSLWEHAVLHRQLVTARRETMESECLLNASPYGMTLLSERGSILKANPAFIALYGLRDDPRGQSIFSLLGSEERYVLEDSMTRVLHTGGPPLVQEVEQTRPDRSFFARISLVRLSMDGGFRILMTAEDITEAHKARLELDAYGARMEKTVLDRTVELKSALIYAESTRDRIDMILRSVADGLLVTDMHNRIILMNHHAETFLGIALHEAVGMQVGQALGRAPYRQLVEERVAQTRVGPGKHFEFSVPEDADRPFRHIRATSSQVRDKHAQPAGVVTILHDATREHELDTMKSEFLSTAAHELRTPLTTIQGFSDLLINRHDFSEEERERYLAHVNRSAQTLTGIVSDLLDISRIESGQGFSLNRQPHDLVALTRTQVAAWSARCATEQTGHTLTFDASGEEALALVDNNKYGQILENLLSNAVKYSPDGGAIAVSVEADDAVVLVNVTDHGVGMTRGQLERVFEKFFRAHGEDGAIQGTGLGMSIVQHLVQAHGGEIWLESEPGKGTSVSFTLPTARMVKARPAGTPYTASASNG